LSESEIFKIFYQLVNGLNYIHNQHIIHRDLKPENILLNKAGEIKIADFGVSHAITNSLSTIATFARTFPFISPEMLQGNTIGYATDVWSLGVIMFLLVHGSFPFSGANYDQILKSVLFNDPIPIHSQYSTNLINLIFSMLNKNQFNRISTQTLLDTLLFFDFRLKDDLESKIKILILKNSNSPELQFSNFEMKEINLFKHLFVSNSTFNWWNKFTFNDPANSILVISQLSEFLINHNSFDFFHNIETVHLFIPNSDIQKQFFAGWKKLNEIILSEGMIEIGSNCFERCSGLTKINIPSTIKTIGNQCFYQYSQLFPSNGQILFAPGSKFSKKDLTYYSN
jgi:serine/threonine protein kinase